MPGKRIQIFLFASVALLLLLSAGAALAVGPGNTGASDLMRLLRGELPTDSSQYAILLEIRLPRILCALFTGAILAMGGAATQTIFRTPLASPHVLGTINAAALGAVLGLLSGGTFLIPFSILTGTAAAFLLLIPAVFRNHFTGTLILAGIAVNAFCSALMSGVLFLADERLQSVVFWLLGGFWRCHPDTLWILVPAGAAGFTLLFLLGPSLDVLQLGERTARSSGVSSDKLRAAALLTTAVMTACAVSCCGVIGFVGLLVPCFARMLGMVSFRSLLALSALLGALLMLLADTAARMMAAPAEIPVGIFTSLAGAPFFLYLLFHGKDSARGH